MTKQSRKMSASSAKFYEGDVLEVMSQNRKLKYDLVVTSPPYNIRKSYERSRNLSFEEYILWLDDVIGLLVDGLRDAGSICWQVGNYIKDGEVFPIDIYTYQSFKRRGMRLRNRIVWRFNFGLHSTKRLSGRYETVLWFTKTDDYKFNLDNVRIPQLYPGKKHAAHKKGVGGKPSGNPLGKNPSDFWEFSADEHFRQCGVWDIPNVKANHPEKTLHPCQFPIELAERCVLAFTDSNDVVLDPFVGTGTTALAALKHGRKAIGIDTEGSFLTIARDRVNKLAEGTLKYRSIGKQIAKPRPNENVAKIPTEWFRPEELKVLSDG